MTWLVDCPLTRSRCVDPTMTLEELAGILLECYDWVLEIDFDAPKADRYVWYYSEEKLEEQDGAKDGRDRHRTGNGCRCHGMYGDFGRLSMNCLCAPWRRSCARDRRFATR